MAEQPNQPSQTPPEEENEHAEVFSVSQDQDGSLHFSRRDFLYFGMAVGGALLLKGVCPRFGAGLAPTTNQPVQAGMMNLPKVYLHAKPSIDSNIVDTLHPNDIVRLISDRADLLWVEVATLSGQRGWINRSFVDFSRAFKRAAQDPDSTSTPIPKVTLTPEPNANHILTEEEVLQSNKSSVIILGEDCGQAIQNGDFETGHVSWVEVSSHGTNVLITNTWADPFQGSWVAKLGGVNYAVDTLTQQFHFPADVDDVQTLEFYLKVTTSETSTTTAYDKLFLRFLDADGTPIRSDVQIGDNLSPMDWTHKSIQLPGFNSHADQDIQVQFKATTDISLPTNFVIDLVSLGMTCGTPFFAIYLPIVLREVAPTPTRTPTPTNTPCVSYTCSCNSAPSCSGYCVCHSLPTCSCNSYPCSCNAYPCTCDYFPCVCNFQ
jgi:hypothetical protein